jgi:Condensation domain
MPLSCTQRYFLEASVGEGFDPSWQHVSVACRLRARFDARRLVRAVGAIGRRHPVLPTRLAYRRGAARLEPCDRPASAARLLDLRGCGEDEVDLRVSRAVDEPFDVSRGPLWRVLVARTEAEQSIVTIVCHHLVGDALSTWLLLRDLGGVYFGRGSLPAVPSYADFVAEEQERLRSDAIERDLAYWRHELAAAQPDLVEREPGREVELASVETLAVAVPAGAGAAIQEQARLRRVPPAALLVAAGLTAARRATARDDVLAALVTDVRGARFAQTVGVFSDLTPIRQRFDGEPGEQQLLRDVRRALLRGWQRHVPIVALRRRLRCFAGRAPGENPCDLFVNFLPVATWEGWSALLAPFAELSPAFYAPRFRMTSPPRACRPPLVTLRFRQAEELTAWADVRRCSGFDATAGAIVGELETATRRLLTATSEAA